MSSGRQLGLAGVSLSLESQQPWLLILDQLRWCPTPGQAERGDWCGSAPVQVSELDCKCPPLRLISTLVSFLSAVSQEVSSLLQTGSVTILEGLLLPSPSLVTIALQECDCLLQDFSLLHSFTGQTL